MAEEIAGELKTGAKLVIQNGITSPHVESGIVALGHSHGGVFQRADRAVVERQLRHPGTQSQTHEC